MKIIVGWLLLFAASVAFSQTTTNTTCNTQGSGGGSAQTNCTSTTTNPSVQQQQNYQTGQQIGNALGVGLARVMQAHSETKWVKKFCAANPGQSWHWTQNGTVTARGTCPPPEDKTATAANAFIAKHKDYILEQKNADAMIAYLETHNLNPAEEKNNQLHLYAN